MQEKIIPQDISAEQSVLGAMLIDAGAVEKMAETLREEDFYRPSHRIIYRAMLSLQSRNQPVDMVTVVDELNKNNALDDVDGIRYVTLLANTVPTAANVAHHARIVAEKAFYRQLVESGTALASMGYEGSGEVDALFESAEKNLMRLAQQRQARRIVPIQELAAASMDRIAAFMENREALTGLSTGFKDLDDLTNGLQPSDFIILAARPSMGKTALALNIAQNVALRGAKEGEDPKRVAYFSLEMSSEQLVQRMICTEAEVEIRKLRGGWLSQPGKNETASLSSITGPEEENKTAALSTEQAAEENNEPEMDNTLNRLWLATDRIASAGIFIDDSPTLTLAELRSQARKLKAEEGLDLIVIDYLQLMQAPADQPWSANRQHEVSVISRGLKALARELNVPVLALSQLSRSVEMRQVKRPMLSDLRESGSLEQDADIVLFLCRDDFCRETDENP
ncbi:MAG: replicative DNA helicase, partial [Acidaminococcaceae bacterium]|nr:replicative DNA helicase [Acidaminococcaceae bacterium]